MEEKNIIDVELDRVDVELDRVDVELDRVESSQMVVEKQLQASFNLRLVIETQLNKEDTSMLAQIYMRLSYLYDMIILSGSADPAALVSEISTSEHFVHNTYSRDGLLFCNIIEMLKKYPYVSAILHQYIITLMQEFYTSIEVVKKEYQYTTPDALSSFSIPNVKKLMDNILILIHAASHVFIAHLM
jgi:hypothetical protein